MLSLSLSLGSKGRIPRKGGSNVQSIRLAVMVTVRVAVVVCSLVINGIVPGPVSC